MNKVAHFLHKVFPLIVFGSASLLHAQDSQRIEPNRAKEPKASIINGYATKWDVSHELTNGETGKITSQRSSYIELADGLNYQDQAGVWVRTRPEFIQIPGGFSAPFGPHKVLLPDNINQAGSVHYQAGAVTLKSAPLALGYYDPVSGNSAIIANVWNSQAQVVSSNVIVYPNSFKELDASIRYTYKVGEFHQDIILHEAPPPPSAYGLSDSSRLEVLTEFSDDTPSPQKKTRVIRSETDPSRRASMKDPDFVDELLQFSDDLVFGIGRAFSSDAEDGGRNGENEVPVGKRFERIQDRNILIEGVEFQAIQPFLKDLPQSASIRNPKTGSSLAAVLPERFVGQKINFDIRQNGNLARLTRSNKGFVLDYVTKGGGSISSFTFLPNATYYISSGFGIGTGTANFKAGAVLKYANNAYLYAYGTVAFPSTGSQVVFTSKDDDLYGEKISGSTGSPSNAASEALWIYYVSSNTTVQNAYFRWAQICLQYDKNVGVGVSHTLTNCKFKNSGTAISAGINSPSVSISSSKKCNITTATSGCCFTGSLTADCEGDNDFDELPDSWETTYFGNTAQTGAGDWDGDGLINFKEYLAGFSPTSTDSDSNGLGDLQQYEIANNVLVNDPTADNGNEQNTQFESTCTVSNGNIIVGYVDSNQGVYGVGQEPNLSSRIPRFAAYSVSQFGGAVFEDKGSLPLDSSNYGNGGDPVLAVDNSSGNVYMAGTSPRNSGWAGIPVWKSTDNGLTFGQPSFVNTAIQYTDKEWIAVDNASGTGQSDVYLTYFTIAGGASTMYMTVSAGGLLNNWLSAVQIRQVGTSSVQNLDCLVCSVGSDHYAYLAWWERNGGVNYMKTRTVQNSGSTLGSVVTAATLTGTGTDAGVELKRTDVNPVTDDTFEAQSFPVLAASPAKAGHVYLAYMDQGSTDIADVFYVRSTDHGATWTSPARISTTSSKDQWMPAIAIKPDGTKMLFTWYDRRNSTSNSDIEFFGRLATINTDGSLTWGAEFKISTSSYPPVFAGTLTANRTNGHYDPAYPPDVNLHWWYSEWPAPDAFGNYPATDTYIHHVGEYNGAFADNTYAYAAWTDNRLLSSGTLYARNQSDIRFVRITWP